MRALRSSASLPNLAKKGVGTPTGTRSPRGRETDVEMLEVFDFHLAPPGLTSQSMPAKSVIVASADESDLVVREAFAWFAK